MRWTPASRPPRPILRGCLLVGIVALVSCGTNDSHGSVLKPLAVTPAAAQAAFATATTSTTSTLTTDVPTTTTEFLPITEALPTIAVRDASWVDADLNTHHSSDFGGVYVAGDVIVINTRLGATTAASLLRPILANQATQTHRFGDARQLAVVLRHSDLTYDDIPATLQTMDSGSWPNDGKGRWRIVRPDYPAQQIVVEMLDATDADQQFAHRAFGGKVNVIVSYQTEPIQAGGDVVAVSTPPRP